MKNIGIATIFRSDSPGAIYQAYATFVFLRKLGYNPFFVSSYSTPYKFKFTLIDIFKIYKKRYKFKKYYDGFYNYVSNNLPTKIIEDIHDNVKNYCDYLVIGSDQILNIDMCGDFYYPSKFSGIKTICLGSSFGNYDISLIKSKTLFNGSILNLFREDNDSLYFSSLGLNCSYMIDPTFLLGAEEWRRLYTKKNKFKKGSYVLVFGNCYNNVTLNFAKQIAKQNNLKVVLTNYYGNHVFFGTTIKNCNCCFDLIRLIDDAYCVVTHSYHGFCISLIMNVVVYYVFYKKMSDSKRFLSLINLLSLPDYLITSPKCGISPYLWDNINIKIKEERVRVIELVRGVLDE